MCIGFFMARECSVNVETHVPINFNKSTGTAITKGSILKLTDNMTASASDGDTDIVAGIAQSDALSDDTSVAVYTGGIFRGYAGAAGVTVGNAIITDVSTGDTNELVNADVNSENIVGRALETATDGNTFLFELNPFTVNLA